MMSTLHKTTERTKSERDRFIPWSLYSPPFTISVTRNLMYEELPYPTMTSIRSEEYVSFEGVCCISELPEHMKYRLIVVIHSYVDKQQEILEKKAKAKVMKSSSGPPLYMIPVNGACPIDDMSDEILLNVFSHLNSESTLKSLNRVCKRWRSVTQVRSLWRDVDLSFQPIKASQARHLIRDHCNSQYTRRLALRAVSSKTERKKATKYECFSPGIAKDIKRLCPSLTSLYISHDQIFQVDLRTALPSTLTHLSLPYCNLSAHNFRALFGASIDYSYDDILVLEKKSRLCWGQSPVLKNLKYLDLTGLYISRLSSVGEQWSLPPLLEALILRDTLINLYNITLLEAIANQRQLKELDISLSQLGFEELKILSEGLDSLEVFSMAGCLIRDIDGTTVATKDHTDEPWYKLFKYGFPSLQRVNVRNVIQNSGTVLPTLWVFKGISEIWDCIDTDGRLWDGENTMFTDAEVIPDPLEKSKFTYKKRITKEYHQLKAGRSIDSFLTPLGRVGKSTYRFSTDIDDIDDITDRLDPASPRYLSHLRCPDQRM